MEIFSILFSKAVPALPLLTAFFGTITNSDIAFYDRLEQRQKNPQKNIDLLELAYLCLSLGFGTDAITKMDTLYVSIRDVRGDPPPYLSGIQDDRTIKSDWRYPPLWLTIVIAIIILLFIFFPYSKKLNQYTIPALQTLQSMAKTNVDTND